MTRKNILEYCVQTDASGVSLLLNVLISVSIFFSLPKKEN